MMNEEIMERYFRELATLVNMDSGHDAPEGIRTVAEYFAQAFRELNWIVELQEMGETGPCLIAKNRNAEHYDVLLTGHMDTVFPKGTAKERPYREENGFAFGPGVCDMKAGCLSIIYALRETECSLLEELNIVVILQPDEEIGSPFSRELLCSYGKCSDYCFVFEAAEGADKGYHCIQRKGILRYCFQFHGKAGHAGSLLENGSISAVSEMAYWIEKINSLTDPEMGTTANIGMVQGGTATNVVPAYAEMSGEVRFEQIKEADRAKALMKELYAHAEAAGVMIRQTDDRYEPPMMPSKETREYVYCLQEKERAAGRTFDIQKRGGLSAANFVSQCTAVCIDGMGPSGDKAHSVDEFLRIDTAEASIRMAQDILEDIAERKRLLVANKHQ